MNSTKVLPATIKSLDAFHAFAEINLEEAVGLAKSHAHISRLITFEYFLDQVKCEYAYAHELAQLPYLNELVDTEEKFLEVCKYHLEVAFALLIHPNINKIAAPLKHRMFQTFYNQDEPRVKERRLASPHLAALDLAKARRLRTRTTTEDNDTEALKPSPSVFERMMLDEFDREKMAEIVLRQFPTLKRYFKSMMFGPSGYYATGKVDFKKHFVTFSSNPKEVAGFSAAFAYQLFALRNKLIQEGKLKSTDAFNVVEFGCGNGDLCFNILETILKMAYRDKEWKNFYYKIHYHLVDLSSELQERQRKRTEKFAKKVEFVPGDACKFIPELKDKPIAAAFSNELLDMFAPQDIFFNNEGNIMLGIMIPYISNYHKNKYFKQVLKKSGLSLQKLEAHSKRYKSLFIMLHPDEDKNKQEKSIEKSLFLSEKSFLKLHQMLAKEKECSNLFGFITLRCIDANLVPELADFIKRNPEFTERMKKGDARYPKMGIDDFLENVYKILIPGGELITVDYGDNDYLSLEEVRTYSTDIKRGLDITQKPGCQDMTSSVNFSIVDKEGKNVGFEKVFYGSQHELSLDYFPEAVLSAELRLLFQLTSNTCSDFRVMVQRKSDLHQNEFNKTEHCENTKEGEKEKEKVTENTVTRFLGKSQAVGYGELFAEMQRKSRQLGAVIQASPIEESKAKIPSAFTSLFSKEDISLLDTISLSSVDLIVHNTLLEGAREICGNQQEFAAYLGAIEEKKYVKALRIACKQFLPMHAQHVLGLSDMIVGGFNINEPSKSGLTALDLLEKAGVPKSQLKLKEALKESLLKMGGAEAKLVTTLRRT